TSKLFGIYIIIISILVLSHTSYLTDNNLENFGIITETVNNFLEAASDVTRPQGGGIIGAIFSLLFVTGFAREGTIIITWTCLFCGIIMVTGLSFIDVIRNNIPDLKANKKVKKEKKDKEIIKKVEDEYEEDNKIVVTSVDELINIGSDKEEKIDLIKEIEKEEKVEKIEKVEDRVDININGNKLYKLPSINLLEKVTKNNDKENAKAIKDTVPLIEAVLADFGIVAKVVKANVGPSVTQYEMELKTGTKVSKILSIHREIALALAAKDVRIQAPIPGKKTIGIEIPNPKISMVGVREILERIPSNLENSKVLAVLGRDIMGKPQWMEINKTPHLLVAGSTGSGKSVCINSIITSILMRAKPSEVKLVLVDPKKVELSMYNGVPHLLAPVVTDPKKANIALKKIVVEMERRYDIFSESGTKNIAGYNMYIDKKNEGLSDEEKISHLPFIVVIIDELADLMLVAAKEVEDSIMRITQMARAAGIHLIVATQRPSTDVITGVVKANIPSRISFAVSSSIDSRTILDQTGAEKLLGKGDMLFMPQGENTPIRIQGTFISEEDIKAVADYTISQQIAQYDDSLLLEKEDMNATTMVEENENDEPLYNDIVEFVVTQGKASASLLQRRFRLGYNRAARCIDLLEERGIIGPNNGSKPREVLVKLDRED
ncbi:MAG: DNA translocase FtsK, partial [Mycoplasmatota bacterium]